MGIGLLRINVTTGNGALAIANANVQIYTPDGRLLYETITDANGTTQEFSVEAPDVSLTLDPNYGQPAYSTVNVVVRAPGFVTQHISGVEIVDTQNSILPVNMRPLTNEQNPITDEYIDIPTIGILQNAPYDKVGVTDSQPLNAVARVLPDVLIPDYITVHLGTPANTAAKNVRVRFSDYIKNVVSSEIYSSWPYNSIVANAHAITTFALNRVYTEWYRSRGYNFDITNTTYYRKIEHCSKTAITQPFF